MQQGQRGRERGREKRSGREGGRGEVNSRVGGAAEGDVQEGRRGGGEEGGFIRERKKIIAACNAPHCVWRAKLSIVAGVQRASNYKRIYFDYTCFFRCASRRVKFGANLTMRDHIFIGALICVAPTIGTNRQKTLLYLNLWYRFQGPTPFQRECRVMARLRR